MSKIPGKFKETDTGQLASLVSGKNVLMLGCYCGRALVVVAEYAWATWVLEDFVQPDGLEGVVQELHANSERHLSDDAEVNLVYTPQPGVWVFPDGSRELPVDGVDVVYRDADRKEADRDFDDSLAHELLRGRGGVYVWHDEIGALRWLEVQAMPLGVN